MPNGSPDFAETDRPLLDAFFAPLADTLADFGSTHNLLLTQYWHQEPCWDFMFRHPVRGTGRIMVYKASDTSVRLDGLWWADSYDEFTRYSHHSHSTEHVVDPRAVAQALTTLLHEIVSWRDGDLDRQTELGGAYRDAWPRMGRAWVENEPMHYPIPRIEIDS
jgi:hypothetical protein